MNVQLNRCTVHNDTLSFKNTTTEVKTSTEWCLRSPLAAAQKKLRGLLNQCQTKLRVLLNQCQKSG